MVVEFKTALDSEKRRRVWKSCSILPVKFFRPINVKLFFTPPISVPFSCLAWVLLEFTVLQQDSPIMWLWSCCWFGVARQCSSGAIVLWFHPLFLFSSFSLSLGPLIAFVCMHALLLFFPCVLCSLLADHCILKGDDGYGKQDWQPWAQRSWRDLLPWPPCLHRLQYLGEEAKTRETIDEEGWLHSGDIGKVDQDGQWLVVYSGGYNFLQVVWHLSVVVWMSSCWLAWSQWEC